MFFIIGFSPKKGGEVTVYSKNGRKYTLFYIGNCLSFFFIPIFTMSKVYYISVGANRQEITVEEYRQMKESGQVLDRFENMSDYNSEFRQAYESASSYSYSNDGDTAQTGSTYAGGICPICKNPLDTSFAFCPYCGQKRPRA